MRRFFIAILLVFGTVFWMAPVSVLAVDPVKQVCENVTGEVPAVCKDRLPDSGAENPLVGPNGVITRAISLFSIVLGVASVIVIILSGLRFILANGDSNSVKKARNSIIYAIVGLIIAVTAQAIVSLVLKRL